MEISPSVNCDKTNWLKFLQDALAEDSESIRRQSHQSLTEDPGFLKAVLITFLSMIDEKCIFGRIEVTRFLDPDFLKAISDDSEITFKVVQDYSGSNYLQITVSDQPFLSRSRKG